MKAIAAGSSVDLNGLTWALLWRSSIISAVGVFAAVWAADFLIDATWASYLFAEGFNSAAIMVTPLTDTLLFWRGILFGAIGWIIYFFALKWAIRSLYGKNIGGLGFLLVAMSNDKDSANAN